jgi:hypothetical protein
MLAFSSPLREENEANSFNLFFLLVPEEAEETNTGI